MNANEALARLDHTRRTTPGPQLQQNAKFVEQSLAMRRMSNYLKMTTTYLS
jgi:hypothetical protein